MVDVAVAIPTTRRPEPLAHLLADLCHQVDQKFSVFVLNDGGDPGTRQAWQTAAEKTAYIGEDWHYLENTGVRGLPAARNLLLEAIATQPYTHASQYVVFLDDDVRVDSHFIEQVRKYAGQYDGFCFRLVQQGPATTFDFSRQPWLHRWLTPLVGRAIPALGVFFGGFYIDRRLNRDVDHLNGGCLIYNFTKNSAERFDENLNEGTAVGEDTCFSYGLKRAGNRLAYINTYSYIHRPHPHYGCRTVGGNDSYFWYWKHKLYITDTYHRRWRTAAVFFSGLESLVLSLALRSNLWRQYLRAMHAYARDFGHSRPA